MKFRSCFLLLLIAFCFHSEARDWFDYDAKDKLYTVIGSDLHPSALFQKVSFHSGVEIRYEKSLQEGMDIELKQVEIEKIIRFIDSEFSTLKSYRKNSKGDSVLTSLTILPRGKFQSSELVLALNPVKEAVAHKKGETPEKAQKVFVTRLESLEIKVRDQLENLAQQEIKRSENKKTKELERNKNKRAERKQVVEELRELKKTDVALYERKLKVYSWRYPNLDASVTGSE